MGTEDYEMLAVANAQEIVLSHATRLAPVNLPIDQTLGLFLAENALAAEPLPPYDASVKDGYAVVAGDGPGVYPVVGSVTAGRIAEFSVSAGTVAYITTGAPMPRGADAVVMVEETEKVGVNGAQNVRIRQGVRSGADVRPMGSDLSAGQEVLKAGTRLGAAEIGLLATVGVTVVNVLPRPKVAVLSTGDELVDPDRTPGPGQIRDSNRAMLVAAIRAIGGEAIDLGIASDRAEEIEERVRHGLEVADVLLTSGGVSMGELDLIKPIFEQVGTIHFGRLRMKPGKPCTFATSTYGIDAKGQNTRGERLLFGLPGNPVSSLVTFYLVVAPALRKLAGWSQPHLQRIQVQVDQELALDSYRPEYHRAVAVWDASLHGGHGGYRAASTGNQVSSRLLSMRTANVLLELPQAEGKLAAGSMIAALVIGEL
jgi:gephyrin